MSEEKDKLSEAVKTVWKNHKLSDGVEILTVLDGIKSLKSRLDKMRGVLSLIANDTLMDGSTRKLCRDALNAKEKL
jgi:hypothetical protein